MDPDPPPLLGVSSCLLGEAVRYDGGHKRSPYLRDVLGPHVRWLPVCPEVELGMPVPREPVDLHVSGGLPRMLGQTTGKDWTEAFGDWADGRMRELPDLDGYVLKARSPSCGPSVGYHGQGQGPGLWAAALTERRPLLPLVEGEVLAKDLAARDAFLTRSFVGARVRAVADVEEASALHERLELLLDSHHVGSHTKAGLLLAESGLAAWSEAVRAELCSADPEAQRATLERLCDRACADLDPNRASNLAVAVDAIRHGSAPLERARSILRSWARRHDAHGLGRQLWVEPYPRTLALMVVG